MLLFVSIFGRTVWQLPIPAGSSGLGTYNMSGKARSGATSSVGPDTLTSAFQWLSRRPLLALVALILVLLFGSVLVPFIILDRYFSAQAASAGGAPGAGLTDQLFVMTSNSRTHLQSDLQSALGIPRAGGGGNNPAQAQVAALAAHGHEYARSKIGRAHV